MSRSSSSASDDCPVVNALFPAYATCTTSKVSSDSTHSKEKVGNEWLSNKSFMPEKLPCLPLHERDGKKSEPDEKNEHAEESEIKYSEEQNTTLTSGDQKESLSYVHLEKKKHKHKERRKHRSRSRSPQKLAKDEGRGSGNLYKVMSKMVFIEETGLAVEHAFCVDPKPDKHNLAFPTFYHKYTSLYNKLNSPPLGTTVIKNKTKKSTASRRDRYWHKNNSVFLYKVELQKLSKPPLDFHCNASNYIPLELSMSELKSIERKESDTTICNNAFELYQKPKLLNNEQESSEEEPAKSSEEHYIILKTQEYNKALRENPLDEEKWLEFVAFQDELLNISEPDRNKKAVNKIKDTAILEKKIAILEKSLISNPGSVRLAIAKLQLLKEVGEIDEIMKEWKQLVFHHPNDTSLWQQYIFFVQSHLSYFTVSRTCKLYAKCIGTLNKLLAGTFQTHRPSPDLEDKMLGIFFHYCCFLCQCGYIEKALATFQALVEFNMFQPSVLKTNSNQEKLLTFFEPFWDSGAPRFGEDGALGWDKVLAEKKLVSPQIQKSKDVNLKEDEIINRAVTKAQTWLEVEVLREQHYWLPWRPDTKENGEEDCEDPERSVLIDDISDVLFLLKSERTKVLAIVYFLRFLGVEFRENSGVSHWNIDDYCDQYIIEVPGDVHPFLQSTNIPYYLDESKEVLNLPLLASHHRFIPFVEKVFEQALRLFSSQYSKFLSLCWVQFKIYLVQRCSNNDKAYRREVKNAKKLTKSLLKEEVNRNNLDLWKEYGRLEHLHGNIEDVEKVFQTALLTYPSVMINHEDIWDFVKTYVELQLGINFARSFGISSTANHSEQSKARALWMLCFLGSSDQYEPKLLTTCSQIPATKILKARNGFQKFVNQQEAGNFHTYDVLMRPKTLLVTSTICFAYFQYLSQDVNAAANVYEDAIKKLNNSFNSDHKASYRREMENLFASYLQLFVLHSSNAVVPLKSFRSVLLRGLGVFPQNSYFLWLFLDLETGSGIANHFRKYFNKILMKESTASLTEWLFAVVAEVKCHEKLQTAMHPVAIANTGITWKIRSLFERALKLPKLRHSSLLWRMYIKFEANRGDNGRAKAVFYQALQHCPWSKVLYVDGVKYFPNDIQEILDITVEKGLRIRTPVEEIQLLLEHAGVIVEKEPPEPPSPCEEPTEVDV